MEPHFLGFFAISLRFIPRNNGFVKPLEEGCAGSYFTVNYETRALRLFCHCEPPLAASEAWREAIQKQPELTAWFASALPSQ